MLKKLRKKRKKEERNQNGMDFEKKSLVIPNGNTQWNEKWQRKK
jgi:hypothetical protein